MAPAPHLPVSPFQGPSSPMSQPPLWERVREEQMPGAPTSHCLPSSSPILPRPPVRADPSPSVRGARSSQGAPTLSFRLQLMFTSHSNAHSTLPSVLENSSFITSEGENLIAFGGQRRRRLGTTSPWTACLL